MAPIFRVISLSLSLPPISIATPCNQPLGAVATCVAAPQRQRARPAQGLGDRACNRLTNKVAIMKICKRFLSHLTELQTCIL